MTIARPTFSLMLTTVAAVVRDVVLVIVASTGSAFVVQPKDNASIPKISAAMANAWNATTWPIGNNVARRPFFKIIVIAIQLKALVSFVLRGWATAPISTPPETPTLDLLRIVRRTLTIHTVRPRHVSDISFAVASELTRTKAGLAEAYTVQIICATSTIR